MSISSSSTFFLQLLLVLICMNSTFAGSIREKTSTVGEETPPNFSVAPSRTETILPNSSITKSVEPVSNSRNTDDTLEQNIRTKLGSSKLLGYPLVPRDIFGGSRSKKRYGEENHEEISDGPNAFLFAKEDSKVNWKFHAQNLREEISDSPKAFLFAKDDSKENWKLNAQTQYLDRFSHNPKSVMSRSSNRSKDLYEINNDSDDDDDDDDYAVPPVLPWW